MKKCSKCKIEKSFENFYKHKNKNGGFNNQCKDCVKKYQEKNKKELNKYKKQYYQENKEIISEYHKEYYKKNKDSISEHHKQYYQENKDKISESNKKYSKLNPDKTNARAAKRKAKKLQATPSWLTEQHFECIERFFRIAKEMKDISGIDYHVDHIIPLQGKTVCGLHVPWNLQILEASENLSKNNKLLDQDQKFYHQIPEFDDLMENICEKY